MSSRAPARRSPCRRRPTTTAPSVSTRSEPAPRPPRCSAGVPRASFPCRSSRSRLGEGRRSSRAPCLFLRGFVERHGERLHIAAFDQISDLYEIEVLRVLRLDGLGVALGTLDRDGVGLLVNGGDRGGSGGALAAGARAGRAAR